MTFTTQLGNTDLEVSALGLGTVKLGRNEGVKYPASFKIPDDNEASKLLSFAHEQGICLLDTAPAYGNSEERLGKLLTNRHDWIIATKTGEEFERGHSHFDFSGKHTRFSIERSLSRLKTDYLDLVLIHSDGNDLDILNNTDCLETLKQCQQDGLIRAIGMSTKTEEGGILAASLMDVIMITWNFEQQDKQALAFARTHNKGVLIKKGLMSGHASGSDKGGIESSFRHIFSQPGIHSAIVGTINLDHLKNNCSLVQKILEEQDQ